MQVTIGTNDVQRTGDAVKYTIEQMGGQILEGPGMLPISKVEMISFVDPEGWKVVSYTYMIYMLFCKGVICFSVGGYSPTSDVLSWCNCVAGSG
jgi:predicted glycosyltransferase